MSEDVKRLLSVWASGKLVIAAVLVLSSLLLTPYNDQLDIFYASNDSNDKFNSTLRLLVKPFIRWDAIHFLDISINGYSREKQFAFLPLYPRLARSLSLYLQGVEDVTREALSLVIVSNASHLLGMLVLYYLTVHLFNDVKFAYTSAAFFALNPSLVHMSAGYSESLCALLVFLGFSFYYKRASMMAAVCWSLASATRANAVLFSGFFIFRLLHNPSLISLMQTAFYVLLGTSGFMSHLLSGFKQFCLGIAKRPWCHSTCPNIYSFVQKEYWNVGLLNYYTLQQIPNFLIASPMIAFSAYTIYNYASVNKSLFWSVGFLRKSKTEIPFFKTRLLPHIYLLLVMLLSTVFVAHVQIITRLFTSMPIMYWSMAHHYDALSAPWKSKIVMGIGCFALANSVLFSAFYPPA